MSSRPTLYLASVIIPLEETAKVNTGGTFKLRAASDPPVKLSQGLGTNLTNGVDIAVLVHSLGITGPGLPLTLQG